MGYVIPKSFPPLLDRIRKLVRKSRLSGFWRSVWRRYGRVVLDEAQIEWIVRAEGRGIKNGDIARIQGISTRRVRQLYSGYRRTGVVPTLGKPGRPKSPPITRARGARSGPPTRSTGSAPATWRRRSSPRASGLITGGYTGS